MVDSTSCARQSALPREGNQAESGIPSDEFPFFGIRTRLEQLKDKLLMESEDVTRVIGVVGMPGIGKTTLAKELLEECKHKFLHTMFLDDVRQKSKVLATRPLEDLLIGLRDSKKNCKEGKAIVSSIESLKEKLSRSKVFIVLDDVSERKQIDDILGGREWIKKGSKIVITTSSKSAIMGMVDSTYLVPGLSESEALSHFGHHAFFNSRYSSDTSFVDLAREFVDYSRGHPSALKLLARELRDKSKTYWEDKLKTLANSPINTIQDILRIPYDELSEQQKNVFLDIAFFFRFENENYLRSLLDSSDEDVSDIKDLADKFFINITGGRVEMNDLLYTFAMGLDSQGPSANTTSGRRLSNHRDIIAVLKNKVVAAKVRGIYLDMSQVTKKMSLDSKTFSGMDDLRYLKFFNSHCHRECEADCKLNFPEGLEFVLSELRYLNWLKFPLRKLPKDFNPKNLIDLKLPYSHIEQVWEDNKDASKLLWVDMNHSSKLHSLSGLSRARNLQSMNLEGCTSLKTVHQVLEGMKSLMFLNLRGCTSLKSLPDITLISLRTLILSDCSSFEDFHLIAEKLEKLYLDGTAIKVLPSTIGDFQRLILLKLKDCKKLLRLPDTLGNLKAIQELILTGCSSLKSFPDVKQNLKHLKTLLLDGTGIEEMPDTLRAFSPDQGMTSSLSHCAVCEWPRGVFGLSSVRCLSLSRNEFTSLPVSISYLYHLKWLHLKHCKKLVSVPLLPPNLQWLDAHGCISLEEISIPLDHISTDADHLHSTFIFTNCTKLNQAVKNNIVSYAEKKIHLMSNALARYDEVFVLDVLVGFCYPGCQVPMLFNQRTVGSELKPKLPRHWNIGGLTGIALCAVVSFDDYQAQNTRHLVTCTGEFKDEDEPLIQFSCILGGWTENGSYEPREMDTSHVIIGYTSWLHIKKRENKRACVATEASFKFQVTDGTREVTNCKVHKCGFSLIYAPTEPVQSLCTDATPSTNGVVHSEPISDSTTIAGEERNDRSSDAETPPNAEGAVASGSRSNNGSGATSSSVKELISAVGEGSIRQGRNNISCFSFLQHFLGRY